MKYLETLTPAENLLLMDGRRAKHKMLLKCTLMDLLLKRVLVTKEIVQRPNPRDPEQTYIYIYRGPEFENYQAKKHEDVFLSAFFNDQFERTLFKNIVKTGYQNAMGASFYRSLIVRSPGMVPYAYEDWWDKTFGGYSLTPNGRKARYTILAEIGDLKSKVEHAPANEIPGMLLLLYGNAFLFYNAAPLLFAEMDEVLINTIGTGLNNPAWNGGTGNSGCGGGGWDSFDHYSSDFDSGCGGFGSGCSGDSGGSGCGGDGGCSGCGGSGCGGGGCGGGD